MNKIQLLRTLWNLIGYFGISEIPSTISPPPLLPRLTTKANDNPGEVEIDETEIDTKSNFMNLPRSSNHIFIKTLIIKQFLNENIFLCYLVQNASLTTIAQHTSHTVVVTNAQVCHIMCHLNYKLILQYICLKLLYVYFITFIFNYSRLLEEKTQML